MSPPGLDPIVEYNTIKWKAEEPAVSNINIYMSLDRCMKRYYLRYRGYGNEVKRQ